MDAKPLNLSGLCRIRKSAATILKGLEREPRSVAEKLAKCFEAKKHVLQGRIFCFRQMLAEERESYRKALNVNPADRDALHLLKQAEFSWLLAEANQRLDAGDPERACQLYRKALRVDPTSAAPEYNLGVVQLRRGCFEKALHHFKNAAVKAPWNAEIHYNLAMCYWKMGRRGPCRLELEKALTQNPGMEKARHALEGLKSPHVPDEHGPHS